jgi:hypothetical protein
MTMTAETDGTGLVFEVQDTTGTPATPFYAVVNLRQDALREVIKVSSKTGTSLSIASLADRYLEGSAASSGITHPIGSQILLAPVSQNLKDLWDYVTDLDASDVTSGTFNADRIPNLDAAKITTGTFAAARIPTGITPSFRTSTLATETLNFSLGDEIVHSTRAGTLAFAGSNYAAGVSKTVIWNPGAANRTVTFPAGWVFVSLKPTTLLANKRGVLTVTCHGTTEASVTAAWAAQG